MLREERLMYKSGLFHMLFLLGIKAQFGQELQFLADIL
jgi:hypothetical protein